MNILYRSQVYIDNAYTSSTGVMRERERVGMGWREGRRVVGVRESGDGREGGRVVRERERERMANFVC